MYPPHLLLLSFLYILRPLLSLSFSLSLSLSRSLHPNKHHTTPTMENQDNSRSLSFINIPTTTTAGFLERGRRIKMAAEMGLVESSRGRHWSRALRSRLLRRKGNSACGCREGGLTPSKVAEDLVGEDGDDEVIEIERRLRALQKLVPGGEDLAMDQLFEETADYIGALQGQVNVMRALAGLLDGLDKEKRLMGG